MAYLENFRGASGDYSSSVDTKTLTLGKYLLQNNKSKGIRVASRAAAPSKMERFVIIVNGFQPLTIITKHSILDVAAALDPPLGMIEISI